MRDLVYVVIAAIVAGALLWQAIVDSRRRRRASETSYERMRNFALRRTPEELELSPLPTGQQVYGVVMDMDVQGETATLSVHCDDGASLSVSNGGVLVDAFSRESLRRAGERFLQLAQSCPNGAVTTTFPRPGPGQVTFYLLTPEGVFTRSASERELLEGDDSLAQLSQAGRQVISELHRIEESPDPEPQSNQ